MTTSSGRCGGGLARAEVDAVARCAGEAEAVRAVAVTNDVTSYSTQLFVAIAPLSSVVALVRGGRLFQLIAVSVHAGLVVKTAGPSTVPLYA